MGCVLRNLKALELTGSGTYNLKPKHSTFYCNTAWPQYKLGDQEVWPMIGSLNFNTILHLDLYHRQLHLLLRFRSQEQTRV